MLFCFYVSVIQNVLTVKDGNKSHLKQIEKRVRWKNLYKEMFYKIEELIEQYIQWLHTGSVKRITYKNKQQIMLGLALLNN